MRFDHGGLWVVFSYSADRETILSNTQGKNSGKTGQMVSRPELQLESRLESRLAARVAARLAAQSMGKAALAISLGHKMASGELHKQVKRMLEMGVIAMTCWRRLNIDPPC